MYESESAAAAARVQGSDDGLRCAMMATRRMWEVEQTSKQATYVRPLALKGGTAYTTTTGRDRVDDDDARPQLDTAVPTPLDPAQRPNNPNNRTYSHSHTLSLTHTRRPAQPSPVPIPSHPLPTVPFVSSRASLPNAVVRVMSQGADPASDPVRRGGRVAGASRRLADHGASGPRTQPSKRLRPRSETLRALQPDVSACASGIPTVGWDDCRAGQGSRGKVSRVGRRWRVGEGDGGGGGQSGGCAGKGRREWFWDWDWRWTGTGTAVRFCGMHCTALHWLHACPRPLLLSASADDLTSLAWACRACGATCPPFPSFEREIQHHGIPHHAIPYHTHWLATSLGSPTLASFVSLVSPPTLQGSTNPPALPPSRPWLP